jgi:hypothetical protein
LLPPQQLPVVSISGSKHLCMGTGSYGFGSHAAKLA